MGFVFIQRWYNDLVVLRVPWYKLWVFWHIKTPNMACRAFWCMIRRHPAFPVAGCWQATSGFSYCTLIGCSLRACKTHCNSVVNWVLKRLRRHYRKTKEVRRLCSVLPLLLAYFREIWWGRDQIFSYICLQISDTSVIQNLLRQENVTSGICLRF